MAFLLPTLIACVPNLATPVPHASVLDAPTDLAPRSSVVAQDPVPDDKRPEVAEAITKLKDHVGKRGAEDRDAIEVMTALIAEFEKSGPKDRKAIAGAISNAFKVKRKEDKDGRRDNKLFVAAAEALGTMGPESVKSLQGWIGHKSHKKDLVVQRALILALGKTKDGKSVKSLINLLNDKDATIQAAAAEALGNYDGEDQKVRKEIFEEVLKIITAVHNIVETDVTNNIERERYDAIKGSMITTLQVMSGASIRQPNEFRTWWNKNKRRNWDED